MAQKQHMGEISGRHQTGREFSFAEFACTLCHFWEDLGGEIKKLEENFLKIF